MAYDLDDTYLGKKLGEGTLERLSSAIVAYRKLTSSRMRPELLMAAGYADSKDYPLQSSSLAQMMADHLETELGQSNCELAVLERKDHSNIWGSKAEIKQFFEYAEAGKKRGYDYRMHVVSHWWHIPRLWLLCKSVGTQAHFVPASGVYFDTVRELYKLPAQALLTVRDLIMAKRS